MNWEPPRSTVVHFSPRPGTAVDQPSIPSLDPPSGEELQRQILLELRRIREVLERVFQK